MLVNPPKSSLFTLRFTDRPKRQLLYQQTPPLTAFLEPSESHHEGCGEPRHLSVPFLLFPSAWRLTAFGHLTTYR